MSIDRQLVLVQLREMHGEVREQRSTVDENTTAIEQQGKRIDDTLEMAAIAAGFASLASHKYDQLEGRVSRLEKRVDTP